MMIRFILCVVFFISSSLAVVKSLADPIEPVLLKADIGAGQKAFQQCVGCHTTKQNEGIRIGPNLWEVAERKIGGAKDFNYSEAFKKLKGNWDYPTLNAFLSNPAKFAPGTRMVIAGIQNDEQRTNLIAYLYTLSNSSALAASSSTAVPPPASDPFGKDWPQGEGRDVTGYSCSVCHSLAIVKQQGLSYESWDELIEWMVDEQGMDPLPEDKLKSVLGYLSTHFNEERQ